MKNIWKRSLSMLLALVLVLGMVPGSVFAATSVTSATSSDPYIHYDEDGVVDVSTLRDLTESSKGGFVNFVSTNHTTTISNTTFSGTLTLKLDTVYKVQKKTFSWNSYSDYGYIRISAPAAAADIQVKDDQDVRYYTGMDSSAVKNNIFAAIYDSEKSTPNNLTAADVTIEVNVIVEVEGHTLYNGWADVTDTLNLLGTKYRVMDLLGDSVEAHIVFDGNANYGGDISENATITLVDNRAEVTVTTPVTIPFAESGMLAALKAEINANPSGVTYYWGARELSDSVLVDAARENPEGIEITISYITIGNADTKPSSKTVVINFTGVYYDVPVTGGNVNNGASTVRVYYNGESVTITVDPTIGYTNTLTATSGTLVKNEDGTYTLSSVNNETALAVNSAINYYTVTFKDEDGTVLKSENLEYGAAIVAPADPAKLATAEWTYTFDGWDKDVAATVTGNAEYTATYSATKNSYTVTFKDEDGTVLKSETLEYGAAIVAPADPTKADDQDANGNIMATYTFAGWGSEVAATVTGDVVYTAKYDKTVAEYTVTIVIGEESKTFTFAYGYSFTQPENPAVPAGYGFECWEIDGKCAAFPLTVVKNVTLTAKFVNHAAMIGQTYYESLQAALAAAKNGDEIRLLKDATTSSKITINKEITLNGNGYSVIASNAAYDHLIHINASNVTIQNITFDCTGTKAVNVIRSQNVRFEDVSIINSNRAFASLTVNRSTLTIAGTLYARGCSIAVDVDKSEANNPLGIVAENGAVLDLDNKQVKINSAAYPNTDLDGAKSIDGTSYYSIKTLYKGELFGYSNTLSGMSVNGYTRVLLEDMTVNANTVAVKAGIKGTLDLNGHVLTIADDKTFTVSGELTVVGNGDIAGDIIFDDTESALIGPAGLSVKPVIEAANLGFEAIYEDGVYTLKAKVTWVNGDETTYAYYAFGAAPVAPEGFKTSTDQFSYEFTGWDKEIVAVTGAATYTAQFTENLKSYTIKFVDVDGVTVLNEQILYYGENVVYGGEELVKEFYTYRWDPAVAETVTGEATYKLVWTPKNDANENGIADELETITVIVEGAGAVVINGAQTGTLIYDSTVTDTITVTATPVLSGNVSTSYVSSIVVDNGENVIVAGGYNNFAYTYTFTPNKSQTVTVTFAEAKFTLKDDNTMTFYTGIQTPTYKDLYTAVIADPAWNETFVKSVKYKAREAGVQTVDLSALGAALADVDGTAGWLLKNAFNALVGSDGQYELELGELWLDIGTEIPAVNINNIAAAEVEKIKALIAEADYSAALAAVGNLGQVIAQESYYAGAHDFGYNPEQAVYVEEILHVVYENEAMRIEDKSIVIKLTDDRANSIISGSNVEFEYKDYTEESLMKAIAATLTNELGQTIEGVVYKVENVANRNVGTYTITLKFDGNEEYKPAVATVTLTVVQAPSKIDVPNVNIFYGEEYSAAPTVTNKYGQKIDIDTIGFVVGLDVAELDVDGDGIKGLTGKVQLLLPADLQNVINLLPGMEDGATMTLSELVDFLNKNSTTLESFGLTQEMVDMLNSALETISKVVEAGDLEITLGGSYPTNIGVYLTGAITVDPNYKTAFDVGYIIIKPNAQKVYLNFNYKDANNVFTWELLKHIDLNTSAFDDEALTAKNDAATALVQNLFFGIDEKGELVATLDGTTLGNGAYTQLSFIAEFGNEFYYAEPIVRAFVIVPNILDVQIEDGQGNALDEFNYVFDNTGKTHFVTVNGQRVEAEIHYVGLQTNTDTYNSTEAPKHAGAYVAYVIYVTYNDAGELTGAGFDTAAVVIKPADSTISVTGGTVDYDGKEHSATVDAQGAGVTAPDVTLISGTANVNGEITQIGLEAITGNVNVDFPKWLDQILSVQFADAYANGVAADDLIYKLQQHQAALMELGISEDMIADVIAVLEKIPTTVTVTFNDGVTYTAPGVYVFVGVVTDSDHMPSADTGLLVIQKEYLDFELQDTTVTQNGQEHFADTVNPENSDYVAVIIDRENNMGNIILEDDMNALVAVLEEALGRELPKTIDVASIYAAIDKVLSNIEGIENLPVNAVETLQQIRTALEKLPQTGTVGINGALPTEAGTYEVYAITYSAQYQTTTASAVLKIMPVQVQIKIEDASKYYGQADPDFIYTVKYYDHLGNELADAGIVSVELNRAPGQNVGKYGITATVTNADGKNYGIVALTEDAVLEIKPAEITITVENTGKVYGENDPALSYNAVISEGKGVIGSDLVITVDRVDGEDVGTYAIIATMAENPNYKIISNVDGVFTIEAKEITLADVALNGMLTYNGTAQTQAITVTEGVTYQVSGNTGTNAGEYTLTVTGNGNYTGEVTLPWSIAKAQVQITLENVTVDVDDPIPQMNYTVTNVKGTVPAELLNLRVSVDVEKNAAGQNVVGTYRIKAEYAESDNWTVSVVDANLTVELGDYVCWNMQTGVYYDDLSDGLMAAVSGQTIQMLVEETAESLLVVNAGLTLDLNGSLIEADNVLSFGQIKDSAENVGGLLISNDTKEAFTMLQQNNVYMPLYDVDDGCYRFFAYEFRYHAQRTGTGFITYAYTIDFENAAGYELLAEYGTDTGICFRHYLHWDNLGDNEMIFEYSSEIIKQFGKNALSAIEKGSGVAVLTFNVSGLAVISGQELDSRMEVTSDTNVLGEDHAPSYDVP